MKIFSWFSRLLIAAAKPRPGSVATPPAWRDDPLSHPILEKMSERELADLPMRGVAGPARC